MGNSHPKHPDMIPFNIRWIKSQCAEINSQFSPPGTLIAIKGPKAA